MRVAELVGLSVQANLARLEGAGAFTLYSLPIRLNPGSAKGRKKREFARSMCNNLQQLDKKYVFTMPTPRETEAE